MKKIYKLLLAVLLSTSMVACDYLDVVPDNVATLDNAFTDKYNAEKFLAQCYSGMPDLANINTNPGILAGLESTMNEQNKNGNGMLYAMGYSSVTSKYMDIWSWAYKSINNCNIFIENIDNVPDLTRSEKARWKAEVNTVKAYINFYLVRFYGPIPLLKENLSVGEDTQGIRVYREKIDDVFGYIIELLDEVVESEALPVRISATATELGRFTAPAAAMLRARVLLTWASPFYNGNTDYNSFLDQNGENFFNQTADPARWTLAQAAIEKAISLCKEADIKLYQVEDYNASGAKMSDTTRLVQALRSSITERWNTELVFGQSRSNVNNNLQGICFARFEPSSTSFPTAKLSATFHQVDDFYTNNGVPIDEDKDFDYANRYMTKKGDAAHRYYMVEGAENAIANFNREPRFYSSLGFNRGLWYGNTYKQLESDLSSLYIQNYLGEPASQAQPGDYNVTGYFIKKLVAVETMFNNPNSVKTYGYAFPEMRYAELLLMYAEVLNEVKSTPNAEVYAPIDEVRARAGLKGVVESWANYSRNATKPLTKEGMREIIKQERSIELAFESHKLWDLIRWKDAPKELSRELKMWNTLEEEPSAYWQVSTLYEREYTNKDYLAPIPEYDIIKNPNLIQNPSW